MPDKWYTKYMAEMRQTPAGCHMVITAEDIRNKVRALEKAAAADSRRVAQVPPDTLKDLVVSQLKTMCKWKKQPGDATLPTTKKALKQLY